MAEMTFEEFYNNVCERYGVEKFTIKPVQVSQEELDRFNQQGNSHVTLDDIRKLDGVNVWLLKDECPRCGDPLSLSFTWGLVHGNGYCNGCHKIGFQYYHYVGDSRIPIRAYSITSYSDKE